MQLLSITLCKSIVRDDTQSQNFCEFFLFEHCIKKSTCYKSDTPTDNDHIITNIPKRFMKSMALETGISDHHKMIMTIFRSTFAKGKPKTFYYRCYKKFNLEQFQMELKEKLDEISNNSFDIFLEEFKTCLDKFAPLKEKKIRFNNSIFMTKSLRKAIMLRSQLKKKFNNNKSEENSKKYKQQRNYCVKLLRKTKVEYFQNMNVNKVNDNKMFWKTVKPRFSNKCKTANTIILTEGDIIIKAEKLIADTFNNYFADITKTLKLKKHPNFDGQSLFSITDYFKNNESVIKIKEKYNTQENSFSFTLFSKEDILKAIKSLSSNKASLIEDIPIKILKNSIHIYSEKLTNIFNECLINGKFSDTLKRADVTPIFKKGNDNEKENYHPVSVLSTFSKVFEKLLFEQINDHMQSKF